MNVSPLESTWGRFYHVLHAEAERIRAMMKATTNVTDSEAGDVATADVTQAKGGQREDSNSRRRAGRT